MKSYRVERYLKKGMTCTEAIPDIGISIDHRYVFFRRPLNLIKIHAQLKTHVISHLAQSNHQSNQLF
jgi:hypothetical protein